VSGGWARGEGIRPVFFLIRRQLQRGVDDIAPHVRQAVPVRCAWGCSTGGGLRVGKEAEKAKDDAQAAREAQGNAEDKFAAAEAARTAAEERLKASEDAAKNQGGFGSRLRSWFGHKPSNP